MASSSAMDFIHLHLQISDWISSANAVFQPRGNSRLVQRAALPPPDVSPGYLRRTRLRAKRRKSENPVYPDASRSGSACVPGRSPSGRAIDTSRIQGDCQLRALPHFALNAAESRPFSRRSPASAGCPAPPCVWCGWLRRDSVTRARSSGLMPFPSSRIDQRQPAVRPPA